MIRRRRRRRRFQIEDGEVSGEFTYYFVCAIIRWNFVCYPQDDYP